MRPQNGRVFLWLIVQGCRQQRRYGRSSWRSDSGRFGISMGKGCCICKRSMTPANVYEVLLLGMIRVRSLHDKKHLRGLPLEGEQGFKCPAVQTLKPFTIHQCTLALTVYMHRRSVDTVENATIGYCTAAKRAASKEVATLFLSVFQLPCICCHFPELPPSLGSRASRDAGTWQEAVSLLRSVRSTQCKRRTGSRPDRPLHAVIWTSDTGLQSSLVCWVFRSLVLVCWCHANRSQLQATWGWRVAVMVTMKGSPGIAPPALSTFYSME
jgi:hypothetical protein